MVTPDPNNKPPQVDLAEVTSPVDEGATASLSAHFSDEDATDTHTATINWGDGSVQAGTVDETGGAGTVTGTHAYRDNASYTVTVTVSDLRGGSGGGTDTVIVDNVAPTAEAGGPYTGFAGSPITFTGSASDPGTADKLTYEWDLDGDGAFERAGQTVTGTFAAAADYTVALRVRDDDGGVSSADTAAVTVTPRPPVALYFSLGSSATLGGVSVANEDIVAFDGAAFNLYFDGSDVGLGSFTIDAFSILGPTEILLSFTSAGTIGGVSMDDSDALKFTATSLGPTTAGTFSMYFDGSDVGLSGDSEDVDAIELLSNGHLLVSTTGSVGVPGVSSGADEDLLEFTPTSLGTNTSGTWALHFDGSDVGLASSSDEDVDAVAVDASGRIHLSTVGSFGVSRLSGADEDVFVFTPSSLGGTTAGTFGPGLPFDGSAYGLGGNDVFAIDLP
jgi:PKD repeat protein